MKKIIYLALLFLPTFLSAQSSYDEQLDYIYSIRMDKALEARKLLDDISRDLDLLEREQKAKYYSLVAHSNAMQGNYSQAVNNANRAVRTSKDIDLKSKSKSLKASALYLSGQYRAAFLETYEVLEELENLKALTIKNDVIMNAVAIHLFAEIMDKSQALSLQSLALARKNKNLDMVCQSQFQLASIKQQLGQYQESANDALSALPGCIEAGNKLYELGLKELIAESALKLKKFKKAEALYLELYDASSNISWAVYRAMIEASLAEIYLELEHYEKVEQFALPSYRYSKDSNDYIRLKNVSLTLAKFYKETGDLNKARLYNEEYRNAMIITSQQLEKSRLGYYQAMNERANNKARPVSFALKNINNN